MARLFAKAIRSGAQRTALGRCEWDVSGDCQSPVTREVHARPSAPHRDGPYGQGASALVYIPQLVGVDAWGVKWWGKPKLAGRKQILVDGLTAIPLTVCITAKCRRCDRCLRKRAAHWRLRAVSETAMASRTWFGTLTLSPDEQHRSLERCRLRERRVGAVDYDTLPAAEQFALRVRDVGKEITKFLKRVREQSQARFRYLLVAEKHATGLPHFHMLLHEWGAPVRERVLSQQWTLGFSQWRLASADNPKAAAYLCKYLSKAAEARVRASARYGQGPNRRPMVLGAVDTAAVCPSPLPPPLRVEPALVPEQSEGVPF